MEVYKYLNGHSPEIINDISKLRENMYNLRNFRIFRTENTCPLKYGLDAIPYCPNQFRQQVPIDIREATSLALFEYLIKTWKWEDCPCRSCKIFTQNFLLGPTSN